MKRFDLLRSPLLLLAVGVLLLNDFVLKAAFHHWLTGKLSDVAGLAAFTIFWCAIWPRHVWTVGGCIAVVVRRSGSRRTRRSLIEAANAGLPFTIGRIVDYSDLIGAARRRAGLPQRAPSAARSTSARSCDLADRGRMPLRFHGDVSSDVQL